MSETVWLQTNHSALINTAHISMMAAESKKDYVVINIWIGEKVEYPIEITQLKSVRAAKLFIKTVSDLIKQNKKLIDTQLITDQCNANPESDV